MKKNNLFKTLNFCILSFLSSFLFLLSFHPSSILEKFLFVFISAIEIFSIVGAVSVMGNVIEEERKGEEETEKEKDSEES